MTIGKKLYAGFGLILATLSVLFIVNIFAGWGSELGCRTSRTGG